MMHSAVNNHHAQMHAPTQELILRRPTNLQLLLGCLLHLNRLSKE
jgi:hypothetical protein